MSVDLRQCNPGDKLLTKHGTIMEYVGPNDSYFHTVFPHRVKYPNGEFGSRTDEGWVFRFNRRPEDEDIVEILK